MRILASLVVGSVLGLLGCGSDSGQSKDVSDVHFITFGPNVSGLVAKVKQPRVRVCLAGIDEGRRATWRENIEKSILSWVKPLRALTRASLTTAVDVVNPSSQCDMDVEVNSGTHSNTSIGRRPVVRMSPTGYFGSYNVLLHEFGHAFALGDTYQNGQSGNCRPGQPQAVMCNTKFDDIQPDDIAGISQIFRRVFPRDEPPTSPPEDTKIRISLALGKESASDRYRLHAGVLGDSGSVRGVVSYCIGTRDECTSVSGIWHELSFLGESRGVPLFASEGSVGLEDGLKLTLRFKADASEAYGSIAFERAG